MNIKRDFSTESLKNTNSILKESDILVLQLSDSISTLIKSFEMMSHQMVLIINMPFPNRLIDLNYNVKILSAGINNLTDDIHELYKISDIAFDDLNNSIQNITHGSLSDFNKKLFELNTGTQNNNESISDWISLLSDVVTILLGTGAAVSAFGGTAVAVFAGIALAITEAVVLINEFSIQWNKLQQLQKNMDFLNREKENGTYWGLINPSGIKKEQVEALKRKSDQDPAGTIIVEGVTKTNKQYYEDIQKLFNNQNTLPAPKWMVQESEANKSSIERSKGFTSGFTNLTMNRESIELLNTRQQILQEIEEIEKKIAIEDLPLQKKEFEKQIETLQFKIRLLSGEFEKINLEGLEPKKLPEDNTEITPRSVTTSGKKKKDNKESIFFLKAQLGLIKSFEEAIPNLQNSFQGLFAAFVPPQGAADPFRDFMKEVVLTFLNAVELMMYEAGAASFFKAILTGSLSLTKDIGLMAAGMAALQIAKGFIGGFAKGTDYLQKSGYALVGEQGPELVYLNRGAKVFNNNDTSKMLNSARGNMHANMNVNNVYISSSLDALTFFRVNYPKYKKFKRLQSN